MSKFHNRIIFHPIYTWKRKTITNFYAKKLLVKIFDGGESVYESPNIEDIRNYCGEQINTLWEEVRRFEKPHKYFVDLSESLWTIKNKLLEKHK